MKKSMTALVFAGLVAIQAIPAHALFGGGISGPLPVYNTDKTVDAATIATQVNTAQQLQAELQNLASMDPATAAANMGRIQSDLQQLINLQNQMNGLVMDYSNFQNAWDAQYQDFGAYNGMSAGQYATNAQQLLSSLNQSLYNSMLAQGLVAQTGADSVSLQNLLDASQNAQGALAAAQVANQMAAMQAQQLMKLQQIVATSNRAQSEWMAYQAHKEAMAQASVDQFFERQ